MNTEEEKVLDIKDLLGIILNYRWILAICILACVIISFVYYSFFVAPVFTSSSVIYVNCMSNSDISAQDGISQYEIESSRALSMTYMEILHGRTFLNTVSADIGYRYDWKELSSMINISQKNETELLSINVTALNPEDAYIICKSVVYNAPSKMINVFKRGTIEVIDDVSMPRVPIKVGITRKIGVGFIRGIVLGAAIVFILEIFDTKIRSSEALIKRYNINVLGDIIN